MPIPPITDKELRRRSRRIKPYVRKHFLGKRRLVRIKGVDLRNVSFLWAPKPLWPVLGVRELATIRTLHTYGYHGLFKPSIAEVLAQIPDEHLRKAVGFTVKGPHDADDLNREKAALDEGYHVAQTTLYTRGR